VLPARLEAVAEAYVAGKEELLFEKGAYGLIEVL
jgi:hypothetical protein